MSEPATSLKTEALLVEDASSSEETNRLAGNVQDLAVTRSHSELDNPGGHSSNSSVPKSNGLQFIRHSQLPTISVTAHNAQIDPAAFSDARAATSLVNASSGQGNHLFDRLSTADSSPNSWHSTAFKHSVSAVDNRRIVGQATSIHADPGEQSSDHQVDSSAGRHANHDHPELTSPDQNESAASELTLDIGSYPFLEISETSIVTDGSLDSVGDEIVFSIKLSNTGDTALYGIEVTNPLAITDDNPTGLVGIVDVLLPGSSSDELSFIYHVTEADLASADFGITSTSSATALTLAGEIISFETSETLSFDPSLLTYPDGSLEVILSGDPIDGRIDQIGDIVVFKISVVNTGTVPVFDIEVWDSHAGDGLVGTIKSLQPGETSTEILLSYVVTEDDLRGSTELISSAYATGTTEQGGIVDSPESTISLSVVPIEPAAALEITISCIATDGILDQVGEPIETYYIVSNTGDQTIRNIEIHDARSASDLNPTGIVGTIAELLPGTTAQKLVYQSFLSESDLLPGSNVLHFAASATGSAESSGSIQALTDLDVPTAGLSFTNQIVPSTVNTIPVENVNTSLAGPPSLTVPDANVGPLTPPLPSITQTAAPEPPPATGLPLVQAIGTNVPQPFVQVGTPAADAFIFDSSPTNAIGSIQGFDPSVDTIIFRGANSFSVSQTTDTQLTFTVQWSSAPASDVQISFIDSPLPSPTSVGVQAAPIILDLGRDGFDFSHSLELPDHFFDTDLKPLHFIGAQDGLLAFDYNNDGLISESREVVFTNWAPGSSTDLEAIRLSFDSNHDGVLSSDDALWGNFFSWSDLNHDGRLAADEAIHLKDAGITSIDLIYTEGSSNEIQAGGAISILGVSQLHWEDGSVGLAADAAFTLVHKPADEEQFGSMADPDNSNILANGTSLDQGDNHFRLSIEAQGQIASNNSHPLEVSLPSDQGVTQELLVTSQEKDINAITAFDRTSSQQEVSYAHDPENGLEHLGSHPGNDLAVRSQTDLGGKVLTDADFHYPQSLGHFSSTADDSLPATAHSIFSETPIATEQTSSDLSVLVDHALTNTSQLLPEANVGALSIDSTAHLQLINSVVGFDVGAAVDAFLASEPVTLHELSAIEHHIDQLTGLNSELHIDGVDNTIAAHDMLHASDGVAELILTDLHNPDLDFAHNGFEHTHFAFDHVV